MDKKFSRIIPWIGLVILFAGVVGCSSNAGSSGVIDAQAANEMTSDRENSMSTAGKNQPDKLGNPEKRAESAVVESVLGNGIEENLDPPVTSTNQQATAPTEQVDLSGQSNSDDEPQSETLNLLPAEPDVGFLAPDFLMTTLDGSQVRLSDLRGKKIMINYWVTWCIPCMEEMMPIKNLHLNNQASGFTVISINGIEQDEINKVQEVAAEFGLPFPVLLDQGEEFYKQYRVFSLPTSYLVDENGVIKEILIGSRSEADLKMLIENFIAGSL